MMSKKISKIIVQFEGGGQTEVDADTIPERIYQNISDHISNEQLSIDKEKSVSSLILLEWEDGWKEVVKVQSKAAKLMRYYVIKRPEETGRLVLETDDANYPELIEIFRKPRELKKVTLQ